MDRVLLRPLQLWDWWDPIVLDCPQIPDKERHPILRQEVEAAVEALNMGKSAGEDNIPPELVQAGGETMIDILSSICNKIWKTGEWPTTWTQSLIITLPKKGNLQLCQNYRTISLISHPSKGMLKITLNRLHFIFDFTAAGVVPCGGRKTSPRTSTIVQFIFYFGPLRSAIIFWEIRNEWLV